MPTHSEALAALSAANVVHVYAAARAAGLSFRNGPSKQDVINLLSRNAAMTQAAYSYLVKNHGDPLANAPQEQPAPVIPSASEASVPLAPQASVPAVSPSLDPAQQMAAAIRALASGAIDESRVRAIMREELEGFEVSADSLAELVRSEVAKLDTGITINLPGKLEPIKLPEQMAHAEFPTLLHCVKVCADAAARVRNIMLIGPAGAGKTTAAQQCAKALGLNFVSIPPALLASDILGYMDAKGEYAASAFRRAFETPNTLILMDEMDSYSAEALLAANNATANGFCGFPDAVVNRAEGVVIVAGTNTDGSGASMQYSGRARIDGATLDRFIKLEWNYDPKLEKPLAGGKAEWLACVQAVREFAASRGILDVVATPRATIFGADLLASGMARDKVLSLTLKQGALRTDWEAVKALPAVREFLAGF